MERWSMSFLSSMQIPSVTWDLAGIKRGTKKGQYNGALLATADTAAHWCGGDTQWPSWVDCTTLSLEGMTAGLGLLNKSRVRRRCRKGPQE